MTYLRNTAEGGTNGTTVTTGNSGGVSGDALGQAVIVGGSTFTFDTTQAAHGSCSYRIICPTAGTSTVTAALTGLSGPSTACRCYLRLSASPTALVQVLTLRSASGKLADLIVDASGRAQVENRLGLVLTSWTTSLSVGTWYRLELQITPGLGTTDGLIAAQLFLGDSVSAIHTYSSAVQDAGTGLVTECRWGKPNTSGSLNAWFDDIAAQDTGTAPLGPAIPPARPVSTHGDLTRRAHTRRNAQWSGLGRQING